MYPPRIDVLNTIMKTYLLDGDLFYWCFFFFNLMWHTRQGCIVCAWVNHWFRSQGVILRAVLYGPKAAMTSNVASSWDWISLSTVQDMYTLIAEVYISWCILCSTNGSGEQDITQHPEEIAPFRTEINEEEIYFVKKRWGAAYFHGRRGFTFTVWFNWAHLVL